MQTAVFGAQVLDNPSQNQHMRLNWLASRVRVPGEVCSTHQTATLVFSCWIILTKPAPALKLASQPSSRARRGLLGALHALAALECQLFNVAHAFSASPTGQLYLMHQVLSVARAFGASSDGLALHNAMQRSVYLNVIVILSYIWI